MLIMVKMELELMPDSDMYRFFEMVLELEFLIFLIDIVKPFKIKKQNILYTQTQIIYMVMQCLNFFQQVDSNGKIQEFDLNKYTSNSSKGCVIDVDLEYHN